MVDLRSSDFLQDGSETRTFETLNYQEKLQVVAAETLVELKNSLEELTAVQTIKFRLEQAESANQELLDRIEEIEGDQTAQHQIEALQMQLVEQQRANDAAVQSLQDQLSASAETNTALTNSLSAMQAQLNKFKAVLTQIDTMTDEAIDNG